MLISLRQEQQERQPVGLPCALCARERRCAALLVLEGCGKPARLSGSGAVAPVFA